MARVARKALSLGRQAGVRNFHATRPAAVQTVGSWTWHEDFSNIAKGVMLWGPKHTLKKLMHMKEIRIGDCVGVDTIGNHYYENRQYQYGRHRWVEHAGLPWYSDIEPSNVPTEWYGWLHHMTDVTGNNLAIHESVEMGEQNDGIYDHNLGGVQKEFVQNNSQTKQRGFNDGKHQNNLYWKQIGHPQAQGGGRQYKPKVESWVPPGQEAEEVENTHNKVGGQRSLRDI